MRTRWKCHPKDLLSLCQYFGSKYPRLALFSAFLIVDLVLALYGRAHFTHDPTSIYFEPHDEYALGYSAQRQKAADDFIAHPGARPRRHPLVAPKLCVGIATVARHTTEYVATTVGSLLEGMTAADRGEVHFLLFFAHTDPTSHPLYHEAWVETLPDALLSYADGFNGTSMEEIRQWEAGHNYKTKSLFDYAMLLDACYQTGAPYIATFEDDILAVPGWYPRVQLAVAEIERRTRGRHWTYLRLFYTEHYLGWNSEEWPMYLFHSALVVLSVATFLIVLRSCLRGKSHGTFFSNERVFSVAFIFCPSLIVLYFLAGRVSMQTPSPGAHRMDKYGCCSQAMVIPQVVAPAIVNALLHDTPKEYADQTLEWFSETNGYTRWAMHPALVQHIGTKSSKGVAVDEDRSWHVWNYAFEWYDNAKVQKEGERAECKYRPQECSKKAG